MAPEKEKNEGKIVWQPGKLQSVTKKRNNILVLMEESNDMELVAQKMAEYEEKAKIFVEAVEEQREREDLDSAQKDLIDQYLLEKTCQINELWAEYKAWTVIQQDLQERIAKEKENKEDVNPEDSASQVGKRSYVSTTSSILRMKLEAARSRAQLQVEREMQEKRRLLEEQKLEEEHKEEQRKLQLRRQNVEEEHKEEQRKLQLRRQKEDLEFETKQKMQEALDKVLAEHEEDQSRVSSRVKSPRNNESKNDQQFSESDNKSKNVNVNTQDENFDWRSTLVKTTQMLAQAQQLSFEAQNRAALPRQEVEVFDGKDLTKFRPFLQAFNRLIECRTSNDSDKLYYLDQYTKGDPKEIVRSCTHMDPSEGFKVAMEQLKKEYGNQFRVANAFIKKLKEWPPIKQNNCEEMKRLSVFLMSCLNYMQDVTPLNQLHSPSEIQSVARKLPGKILNRWQTYSYRIIEAKNAIMFKDLVDFVRDQANILSNPIFSDVDTVSSKKEIQPKKIVNCATKAEESGEKSTSKHCLYCEKVNHMLEDCFDFKKQSDQNKSKFIKDANLCFGCLQYGHLSKGCQGRLTCKVKDCGLRHPTCLHMNKAPEKKTYAKKDDHKEKDSSEKYKGSEEKVSSLSCCLNSKTSTVQTGAGQRKVAVSLIPVKVRAKGGKKIVITYAALDNCSTDCFVTEKILKNLGVGGEETSLSLTTMGKKNGPLRTKVVAGLEVMDLDECESILLPVTYSKSELPIQKRDIPRRSDVEKFDYLEDVPFTFIDAEVGLLLGVNAPDAVKPLDTKSGPPDGPYATKHKLGWALNGPLQDGQTKNVTCNFIKVDQGVESMIKSMYEQDFKDVHVNELGPSIEDEMWLKKVETSIKQRDNKHYEIELPFKDDDVSFPDNRMQALQRIESVRRKLKRDQKYCEDYSEFMKLMLDSGFMEEVPKNELEHAKGKKWYIVHHGVYHKQKKKLRVVFNCSLKYRGISLNDKLLQGPDLINSLLGILLRFRQGRFVFTADVEKMFYQVKVPTKHADFLRFFWFKDGNLDGEPVEYRLTVHVFGAASSPSCSNYALQRSADGGEFSKKAVASVKKSFYVDDLLQSVDDEDEAIRLVQEVQEVCAQGGFNLTQFASNSKKILNELPVNKRAKGVQCLDLEYEDLPCERALGVKWNVQEDSFGYKIKLQDHERTRRGVLSTTFSIYDPFKLAGPALLPAKKIFQDLCRIGLDWDDKIPQEILERWEQWLEELPLLENYEIPRCFRPTDFVADACCDLHVFCDGSETGYGAVAYLRFKNADGKVHVSLALANSRLAPIKKISIPKLELTAAKQAIDLMLVLKRELEVDIQAVVFWTDSETVLRYIGNEKKRFQRFVSNKVSYIRQHSSRDQWNYVPTEENPADHASRGLTVTKFVNQEDWKFGPSFLWKTEDYWPNHKVDNEIPDGDPEVKKDATTLITAKEEDNSIMECFEFYSDWYQLRRWVASLQKFTQKVKNSNDYTKTLTLEDLVKAEVVILRKTQEKYFSEELQIIKMGKVIPNSNKSLRRLSPVIGEDGLLRVGGRLARSKLPQESKHQIILPKSCHIASLLVRAAHVQVGHLGQESMLARLREKFWIFGDTLLAKKEKRSCLTCCKYEAKPGEQFMANLPEDRIESNKPPFTNTGVDYFGPFEVKRGRSSVKRYGVIFTCLSSRAIHLEVADSLDTSSFINTLRRFIARRGCVKILRSDNGTNFVGGNREIREAIEEWNHDQISDLLHQRQIEWRFNPPGASHFGGVYEREIRTVRKVLNGLMHEQQVTLNDDMLNTLFCEVEAILNGRPLTPNSDDPDDMEALTANHLLLMKTGPMLPPGLFDQDDAYARKRWRQVQYLSDLFWKRWRKEYLIHLQKRQKWLKERRNLKVGDLVLIIDNPTVPRNLWPLGRVQEVKQENEGGLVRSAKIKTASSLIERPIAKLILIKANDD